MSTPGNSANLGTAHSNIQTVHSCPFVRPWLGLNIQCISQHTTESAHFANYAIQLFGDSIVCVFGDGNEYAMRLQVVSTEI